MRKASNTEGNQNKQTIYREEKHKIQKKIIINILQKNKRLYIYAVRTKYFLKARGWAGGPRHKECFKIENTMDKIRNSREELEDKFKKPPPKWKR